MAQKGIFISSWLEYYLLDQCRILRTAGIAFGLKIMPLDTMMTWIFFQVVLHLTKVIQNFMVITCHFILTISLKFFAELQKPLEKILEKLWHVFVVSSASGNEDEVLMTGKSKQTKNVTFFFKNFVQEFLKFSKKFQRNC